MSTNVCLMCSLPILWLIVAALSVSLVSSPEVLSDRHSRNDVLGLIITLAALASMMNIILIARLIWPGLIFLIGAGLILAASAVASRSVYSRTQ